jgi:hypothetical protein
VKSKPGPAATLGSAAGAGVRLITWCRDYSHQVERDSLRWLLGTVPNGGYRLARAIGLFPVRNPAAV